MPADAPRKPVVIAVDGPAASGKGTLARRLADHFGYAHLDTGLLYRAVGIAVGAGNEGAVDETRAVAAAEALDLGRLDEAALRGDAAAVAGSRVAAIPAVRAALVAVQRRFADAPPGGAPGAVIDGRDIGTVICPDADVKIFIDADLEIRADRRVKELRERGVTAIHARVLQEMRERDDRDRSRKVAPLAPAEDAFIIDTTRMDADAAFAAARDYIASRNKSEA